MNWKTLTTLLVLIAALLLVGCNLGKATEISADSLATCLTEKGVEMYGASWCPHCQHQKELFGEAFEKINFIECTKQQQKCGEAGITGLPTWKFADGSVAMGTQKLSQLAQRTGCLPS